jgi:hypothetical protein
LGCVVLVTPVLVRTESWNPLRDSPSNFATRSPDHVDALASGVHPRGDAEVPPPRLQRRMGVHLEEGAPAIEDGGSGPAAGSRGCRLNAVVANLQASAPPVVTAVGEGPVADEALVDAALHEGFVGGRRWAAPLTAASEYA